MKYTEEQKRILKHKEVEGFTNYFKNINTDPKQQDIQEMIDGHYPEIEKFEIFESKINEL